MRGFYLRWCVLGILGLVVAGSGFWRYQQEVSTLSLEDLLSSRSSETVRVLGRVEPGTLIKEADPIRVLFELSGDGGRIKVDYQGEEPENLRELKTLVVTGQWDSVSKQIQSDKLSVIPNYGFVTAAYLVGVLPLVLFLFGMERRVRLLYQEIKGTTEYEPEKVLDNP